MSNLSDLIYLLDEHEWAISTQSLPEGTAVSIIRDKDVIVHIYKGEAEVLTTPTVPKTFVPQFVLIEAIQTYERHNEGILPVTPFLKLSREEISRQEYYRIT